MKLMLLQYMIYYQGLQNENGFLEYVVLTNRLGMCYVN